MKLILLSLGVKCIYLFIFIYLFYFYLFTFIYFYYLSFCFLLQDFDLCVSCYKEVTHPHPMDRIGIGLDLDPQAPGTTGQKDPKKQRMESIEKCIKFLVHATQCKLAYCKQPSCIKMKRVLTHTSECRLMKLGRWNLCQVCKHFVLLCISHAKTCQKKDCPVPVCNRVKRNMRDKRNQRRVQAQMFMHQRMAQMNNASSSAANPQTVDGASPANQNSSPPNTSSPPHSRPSPTTATGAASKASGSKGYMSAPSPATGPMSVGKGGPRTPASTGKQGGKNFLAGTNSPANLQRPNPSPAAAVSGKPDAGALTLLEASPAIAPNELPITRVEPGSGSASARNEQIPRPMQRPPMQMRPGLGVGGTASDMLTGGSMGSAHPSGTMNHVVGGKGSHAMYQPTSSHIQQQQQHIHQQRQMYQHQQLMRHHHQQQQQQQYAAMMSQRRMMTPNPSMYSNMASHPHSTLEQILTSPHPQQYQQQPPPGVGGAGYSINPMATGNPQDPMMQASYSQQPGGYGMRRPLGPPPQYPSNPSAMMGGGKPGMMPGGPTPGMPSMMGGTGNNPYQQQFSPSGNVNNNNNYSNAVAAPNVFNRMTPQDKLSTFAENL